MLRSLLFRLCCFFAVTFLFWAFDPVSRILAFNIAEAAVPALNSSMKTAYNIIFIITDQEHYFRTYPSDANYRARERLRNIGTTFHKHYACSSMSTSSRSVIYTGKHVPDTKMFDNTNYDYQSSLNPDITTVGDMMKQLGYYTAYKGKFHLMRENDDEKQQQDGLEQYGFSDWNASGEFMGTPKEGYNIDPTIAGDTISWLRTNGMNLNNSGTPFFLAVNFVNPHDIMYFNTDAQDEQIQDNGKLLFPINRAPDVPLYRKQYPASNISETYLQGFGSQVPAHKEFHDCWGRVTGVIPSKEANWRRFMDYYYNTIQDSDNQLLKLISEFESLGLLDNTIIVLTSDHGELKGSHGLNGKGNSVYENNAHVPLIIYHPDIASGDVEALTSHVDLAPTFISMTNADNTQKADLLNGLRGKNILPLLNKSQDKIRDDALFACSLLSVIDSSIPQFTPDANQQLASLKRGIIRGLITSEGYKFSRYFSPQGFNTPTTIDELFANNDVEIFDLKMNPNEDENLAEKLRISSPDLVMRLNSRLNNIISEEIGIDNGKEFDSIPHQSGGGGCSSGEYAAMLSPSLLLLLRKNKPAKIGDCENATHTQ